MSTRDTDAELHLLLRLATATVLTNREELRALRRRTQPNRAWREVLLQATLFAGFPRVIAAFDALCEVGGAGSPEPFEGLPTAEDFAAGRELFAGIYGTGAQRVHDTLREYHPLLERWVTGHAYGRVLTRSGLAPKIRELLAVAMLTASGLDRQLASHARGAVRLGASPDEVQAVLGAIEDLVAPEFLRDARVVVRSFAKP